jgi:hypothetical protein
MGKSNGPAGPSTSSTTRNPQRIVLLAGDEHSEVKSVLAEYPGADLERSMSMRRSPGSPATHGELVAVEWQGTQGWKRFLWCRR